MCAGRRPCGSGEWWARAPSTGHASRSLDHLIRPLEERLGDRQAEGLGGLEVDDQLELRWLLDGQVGGFRALEDLVHVHGRTAEQVEVIGTVADEGPGL